MTQDIFQAIANPTRRSIISMIATEAMTPNALAEYFDTSRQAVSKHIKILTDCGLITQQQSGREIYYYFESSKMKEVDKWLQPFREKWESRFSKLDTLLKNQKNKKS